MDWLVVVTRILEVLAWPVVVLVLALVFRAELRGLALRLHRIRHNGTELEFLQETLENAQSTAERLPSSAQDEKAFVQLLQTPSISSTRTTSETRGAILAAWVALQPYLKAAGDRLGTKLKHYRDQANLIRTLEQESLVPPGTLSLYQDLREMRNVAAHAEEFDSYEFDAETYTRLAARLANALSQAAKQH